MIVIKLVMWPQGDASREYDLGRAHIANVGGDGAFADYQVAVMRKGCTDVVQRRGHVYGYSRQSYNVWRLVIRALKSAFPEETA